MENWSFSEEQRKALHIRTMDCPFFISYAIRPIPNYLAGKVPLDVLEERTFNALCLWHAHRDRETLEECYRPEGEFIRSMARAFTIHEPSNPEKLADFEQAVLAILMTYLDTPVSHRKCYVL